MRIYPLHKSVFLKIKLLSDLFENIPNLSQSTLIVTIYSYIPVNKRKAFCVQIAKISKKQDYTLTHMQLISYMLSGEFLIKRLALIKIKKKIFLKIAAENICGNTMISK